MKKNNLKQKEETVFPGFPGWGARVPRRAVVCADPVGGGERHR